MSDNIDSLPNTYSRIALAFGASFGRLVQAMLVSTRFSAIYYRSRADWIETGSVDLTSDAAMHIFKTSEAQHESFRYISDLSFLVYATTLLDSFLNDTTKFLLLLHPGAIGKDHSIKMDDLLSASSKQEAICIAAQRKVRDISFLSFLARVEYLKERFGLHVELDEDLIKDLDHYPGLRNVIVHDQSVFDIGLDEDGNLTVENVRCHYHPTPLMDQDIDQAIRVYQILTSKIYTSIMTKILKSEPDPEVIGLLTAFTDAERTYEDDDSGNSSE